ncbi:hypothetical protein K1W69_02970 [Hoeflea sp. WL0058]|uniref:SGNH hydrolase-type esterase domain-containing protein n=1 Tax=Flavimaribacter sediminis TaxID=2865987 RepID=A0AAE2ZJG9_9HYPH|nr:hypothetical protein [Flavimaribacter sediminis]MBW8636136.1 hypothetical protein [Flavimaribacter sediminis]
MRRILVYGDSLSRGMIPGTRCAGHVEAFRAVAVEKSVFFFDMNTETTASRVDGIHLDEEQHAMVGNGLAPLVRDKMDGEVRE